MKKILFIANTSLNNPIKGTPLRMLNVALQIAKEYEIYVCAHDVGEELKQNFILYPTGNALKRLIFFLKTIKEKNIEIVFANTDIEIRMPVFLKLFSKAKIAVDLHGLFAEEMYYFGLMSNFKRFWVDGAIKFLIRFYDMVFVCSDKLADYYSNSNSNIKIVYNGVDIKKFKQTESAPDVFTVGYTGNMNAYQGFNEMLEALSNIKKKNLFDFKLNLVLSSGATKIEEILKEHNLYENTNLYLKIDHEKVGEIMRQSSVLVVVRPSLKMTEYAYPSKLPEYMMSGVPAITTDVGPVKKLFGECNCCVIIGHNNIVEDLEKVLVDLQKTSQEERTEMGEVAVKFVEENLSWDVLGKQINEYLRDL